MEGSANCTLIQKERRHSLVLWGTLDGFQFAIYG